MPHADTIVPIDPQRAARRSVLPPALLIGLTGPAGSGKDTVANLLQPWGFRQVAFADALRREVCEAFRVDPRMLTDRTTKEWPVSGLAIGQCGDPQFVTAMRLAGHGLNEPRSARWIMQRWGTDYRRAQQAGHWLAQVGAWVTRQRGIDCRHLVVTDVRFQDEAAFVRALGGRVLRVHRDASNGDMPHDTAHHASERELASIATDDVIVNDGTLEQLEDEALRVLAGLEARP